jgi:riboflavin kinase/FMN adenylyltransferase
LETLSLHYPNLTVSSPWAPSVVAIGMFDGVHLGHQAVIREARTIASQRNLPCTVFTFVSHPRKVLRPDHPVPLLTTWDEKRCFMADLGVDTVVGAQFTPALSELSARDFVERILVGQMRAQHVVVGYNFAFGHGQEGNGELLSTLGAEFGFDVTVVPPFELNGASVSSSRIRKLLATGHVGEANALLGRPYALTGTVVTGDQRGRLLGFPTANLSVDESKLLPSYGVYAGQALWNEETGYCQEPCVVNLGMRPTFDPPQLRIEAHLIGWSGDLYGKLLTVSLQHRLRSEMAFKSVDELVAQIRQDVDHARTLPLRAFGAGVPST